MTARCPAGAVWLVLAGALAACRAAAPSPPSDDAPAPNAPTTLAPTLRRATGTIDVRLARFENAEQVEIAGASAQLACVERRGLRVQLDDGEERDELVLRPLDGALLELGERSYRGELRVRARGGAVGLEVTNRVDLEDYVAGVVAGELALWSTPYEALRAQAVASRSYAVAALDERGRKRAAPYLFDDTRDQVYRGVPPARGARERELAAQLRRAVENTRGIVLMEGERVVDARFHAACGGATAEGATVFPETTEACLASAECAPCRHAGGPAREAGTGATAWRWSAPRAALDQLAQRWKLGAHVVRVRVSRSDAAGRWLEVEVEGDAGLRRAPFEELRRALGTDKLPSSFIVRTWPHAGDAVDGGVLFEGRGRGHGVGLCQQGARGYAETGWSAEQILDHYYRGARRVDFR